MEQNLYSHAANNVLERGIVWMGGKRGTSPQFHKLSLSAYLRQVLISTIPSLLRRSTVTVCLWEQAHHC